MIYREYETAEYRVYVIRRDDLFDLSKQKGPEAGAEVTYIWAWPRFRDGDRPATWCKYAVAVSKLHDAAYGRELARREAESYRSTDAKRLKQLKAHA